MKRMPCVLSLRVEPRLDTKIEPHASQWLKAELYKIMLLKIGVVPDTETNRLSPAIWYYCEQKQGSKWWKMSMAEQSQVMSNVMKLIKDGGSRSDRRASELYPAWPALAWKTDEDGEAKEDARYEFNYACGLIFNK